MDSPPYRHEHQPSRGSSRSVQHLHTDDSHIVSISTMPPLARQRTLESRRRWWSDHNLPDAIFNLHAAAKPLMKFLYHQSKYVSSFTKNAIVRHIAVTARKEEEALRAHSHVLDTRAAVALFKALTQHERISELCHDEVYEQILWVLHALTQDPSPPFANAIFKAKVIDHIVEMLKSPRTDPWHFLMACWILFSGVAQVDFCRCRAGKQGSGYGGHVFAWEFELVASYGVFRGCFHAPPSLILEQTAGGGEGGIGFALLFNPQNKDAGILVNHSGKIADTLVTDALEIVMQGGASCLQSQMRSCPSGSYYDLRPAVDSEFPEASGFPWFTLGGYMARQWDAPILRYMERGVSEPVEKIPDAILELEQFLRVLPAELFPQPQDKSEDETPEVEALLDALEGLANLERSLRQGERIQAIIWQQPSDEYGLKEDGAES
ncbi:hypothetical protein C8J57DRAFT_1236719 [Mycena rebaudengoi]|nr:hypothetical protein C8J57DRAFT_1236719 [Mycena rebaudengoi]